MSALVADAHSDLLMELVHAEDVLGERDPFAARWRPALEGGGVGLQVCALYVDPADGPVQGLRALLRQARAFRTAVGADGDRAFAVHAAEVMGPAHVGLGGDFLAQIARTLGIDDAAVDGVRAGAVLDGLGGPQDYPRLAAALDARGWSGDDITALLGGNLLRVLREMLR